MLPPELREALLDIQFHAQDQQYATTYPGASHDIVVADGVDVGRLIVDESGDAIRIVDVTIHESHRGRGIGSALLGNLIERADRAGRPVCLSVWPTNVAARRLYERLGFTVTVTGGDGGYLELLRAVPSGGTDHE